MSVVSVRYIVNDVDAAVAFYTRHLGFRVEMQPGPGFAMLSRGDLRLLLNTPGGGGGAGQSMPDGRRPEPGGWNRIQLEIDDLAALVDRLSNEGAHFRNDVVIGNGGKQILLDDPSGNAIELFEPRAGDSSPTRR
jgi:catechol 2,3-dioxygenase-like lactoylglutathione lyase family enzyme